MISTFSLLESGVIVTIVLAKKTFIISFFSLSMSSSSVLSMYSFPFFNKILVYKGLVPDKMFLLSSFSEKNLERSNFLQKKKGRAGFLQPCLSFGYRI